MPTTADYMRRYRAANAQYEERNRLGRNAYRRALVILKGRHEREFATILTAERAAVGLPPAGSTKPGPKKAA